MIFSWFLCFCSHQNRDLNGVTCVSKCRREEDRSIVQQYLPDSCLWTSNILVEESAQLRLDVLPEVQSSSLPYARSPEQEQAKNSSPFHFVVPEVERNT